MTFRPLLSGKAPDNLNELAFPVLASPKIDGIRVLITQDGPVTRKLEPIPNHHVRNLLSALPVGFDGEVTSGHHAASDVWNKTQSAIMRHEGTPSIAYHVFDDFSVPHAPYEVRLNRVFERVRLSPQVWCVALPHARIYDVAQLDAYEDQCLKHGYEGVMLRDPDAIYKFGRSTTKQGVLLKLKRWHDDEAEIIGVKERMHNANELEADALGYAKRATKKDNKVGRGDMGALICRAVFNKKTGPVEFDLGAGFTDEQRAAFWDKPALGHLAKFKYQGLTPDGKPRFPIYLGLRDRRDA